MAAALTSALLLLLAHSLTSAFSLELHFYRNSCPRAELMVKAAIRRHVEKDSSIPAALLRLHFHDCFIRGCDASVLIDSTDENVAEKEAAPNLTLRGFEVIDDVKATIEKACPGVVSCADILALATRDGVALSGGAAYAVPTGRRDGIVSRISDVQIPTPSFSVSQALAAFQSINLDLVDLTTLLGAHSIGFCHCGFFTDRLYNFMGTGEPDPQLDSNLLKSLRQKCPPSVVTLQNISRDPTVFMNQGNASTAFKLDQSFFSNVLNAKAILHLDQQLAFTDVTNRIAVGYLDEPNSFRSQFSNSMIKLGSVNVLTGEQGEIRMNCRRVNNDDGKTNKSHA